jgi:hypothetical protein
VPRSVSRPNVSRDAQASGWKRAEPCDVCRSSTRQLALLGCYCAPPINACQPNINLLAISLLGGSHATGERWLTRRDMKCSGQSAFRRRLFLALAAVAAWDDGAAVRGRPRRCVGGSCRWSGVGRGGSGVHRGGSRCARHARSRIDRIDGWNRSQSRRGNAIVWRQGHWRVDAWSGLSEMAHPPIVALPLFHLLHALASWKCNQNDRSETEPVSAHDGSNHGLRVERWTTELREYALLAVFQLTQTFDFARNDPIPQSIVTILPEALSDPSARCWGRRGQLQRRRPRGDRLLVVFEQSVHRLKLGAG